MEGLSQTILEDRNDDASRGAAYLSSLLLPGAVIPVVAPLCRAPRLLLTDGCRPRLIVKMGREVLVIAPVSMRSRGLYVTARRGPIATLDPALKKVQCRILIERSRQRVARRQCGALRPRDGHVAFAWQGY